VSLLVRESDQAVDVAVSGHAFDHAVGVCLGGLSAHQIGKRVPPTSLSVSL
jgi:hypothetical protein